MGFHAVGTFAARQPVGPPPSSISSIEGQKFLDTFDEICAQRGDDIAVESRGSGVT